MIDWQLTATTIYCEAVQDEVTVFVYKDWSLGCTGFGQNRKEANSEARANATNSAGLARKKGCVGLPCEYTISYRSKLASEESNQNA